MKRCARYIALGLALVFAGFASTGSGWALQPDEILSDPALERRARSLSAELRCLVCQNQSIDDSDAPLARDLRLLVRERLVAGDTDEEVRDYVVARYGEFVLLRPPFSFETLLLWFMPLLVLAIAIAILWTSFRPRWARTAVEAETGPLPPERGLTPDEKATLYALLAEKPEDKT